MSDRSTPGSDAQVIAPQKPQKRTATAAGLDGATVQTRSVKRRASKACQCCRARKVRCNVTEHGAPCTNCRLDEVECIVSESRRKKKWNKDGENQADNEASAAKASTRKLASRTALDGLQSVSASAPRRSHDIDCSLDEHVPHSICQYPPGCDLQDFLGWNSLAAIDQTHGHRLSSGFQGIDRRVSMSTAPLQTPFSFLGNSPISTESTFFPQITPKPSHTANIPYFVKPLPTRIGPDDIAYLEKKGALTVPNVPLRNELLKAYIDFVHPFMPLLDLYDFIMIVESGNGTLGRISLILFQAVMFAGSAFVDMQHLQQAGYTNRKEARKEFFQKTRLLYDFDYESDRVSLVQALLLLTYYYETPDDQKDTWHWMGVATSVAHTIGLHRNPERSNMDSRRAKLWKRIWWSTYMRDRLIALGMRRPTRIKTEDYDVPMLTLDDFEIVAIPESVTCIPSDCTLARDLDKQRQMAIMCIEKSKLCLCISHVLSKQYCVLNNNQGLVNDRTTMMLLPKKLDPETCQVKACDEELQSWLDGLPEEAKYSEDMTGCASMDLHRSLLHMVFSTTLSALHRPQVLPSAPSAAPAPADTSELLEISRKKVRRAATAITAMAQRLDARNLVKFLPTTGVTVLLPAIIIHLLDIKAPEEGTRRSSLRGFCQCMQVMGKLRDIYAAADYSTAFLEAAIRKAGINIAPFPSNSSTANPAAPTAASTAGDMFAKSQPISSVEDLVDAGRRMDMVGVQAPRTITPPPDTSFPLSSGRSKFATIAPGPVTDEEVARRLETFLASTPPESDHDHSSSSSASTLDDNTLPDHDPLLPEMRTTHTLNNKFSTAMLQSDPEPFFPLFNNAAVPEFDQDDFDSLLNMDAVGETFAFDESFVLHGGMA